MVALGFTIIAAVGSSSADATICPSNSYNLDGQAAVDALGALNCDVIEGNLVISNGSGPDISNLDGLSGITSIGGSLNIELNFTLTNLDGLSGITSVGGSLNIDSNDALTNLDGLAGITSVAEYLQIANNLALTNLDGLSRITSIGGYLNIIDNSALTNLDGLANVVSVEELVIKQNSVLSQCSAIAPLIPVGSFGEAGIQSNAPGCNSVEQVWGACPQRSYNLYTQAEVDALGALDCAEIEGELSIGGGAPILATLTASLVLSA